MYSDPDGHAFIMAMLIGAGIDALIGFGISYGSDVIDNLKDGFDWADFNF